MGLQGVVKVSGIVRKGRGGDEEKGEKKERIMKGKERGHASQGKKGRGGGRGPSTEH